MRTSGRVVVIVGLVLLGLGAIEVAPAAAGGGGGGGGGCHRDRELGPTEGTGTTVELVELCMTPSVLRVEPGHEVTFVNRDDVSHNVYGSGMFVHDLAPEGRVVFRFDDEGTFPYTCTLHPGMVGAIAVGEGRRTADSSTPIVPVEVQPASAAAAPVPVAARTATDDDFPVVPAAIAMTTIAAVAYLAGRRRVSAS